MRLLIREGRADAPLMHLAARSRGPLPSRRKALLACPAVAFACPVCASLRRICGRLLFNTRLCSHPRVLSACRSVADLLARPPVPSNPFASPLRVALRFQS